MLKNRFNVNLSENRTLEPVFKTRHAFIQRICPEIYVYLFFYIYYIWFYKFYIANNNNNNNNIKRIEIISFCRRTNKGSRWF